MSFIQTELIENNHILLVTLNRPEVRHAFHTEMAQQLYEIFEQASKQPIRALILTSSSEDAFCSGADLKERKTLSDEQWHAQHKLFEKMFECLSKMPFPTITVINGYALAGGFELALNTDLLIAGFNAKVGLTEVTRGIMPGCGGARLLPKRIAPHIAKEWLFTGRIVEAHEAKEAGLFNYVVAENEALDKAIQLAKRISENAPLSIKGVKAVTQHSSGSTDEQRQFEIATYESIVSTEDRYEGILAFNEKRKPIFKGM